MTEYFVPTETQSKFIRSERDLAGFSRTYRKQVERTIEAREAPKVAEHIRGDRREKLTVYAHAITGEVLEVVEGWA